MLKSIWKHNASYTLLYLHVGPWIILIVWSTENDTCTPNTPLPHHKGSHGGWFVTSSVHNEGEGGGVQPPLWIRFLFFFLFFFWGGGGGGGKPPPPGSEDLFFPSSFLCMSERLVMYDGYPYSVCEKLTQKFWGRKKKAFQADKRHQSSHVCNVKPPPPPPPWKNPAYATVSFPLPQIESWLIISAGLWDLVFDEQQNSILIFSCINPSNLPVLIFINQILTPVSLSSLSKYQYTS